MAVAVAVAAVAVAAVAAAVAVLEEFPATPREITSPLRFASIIDGPFVEVSLSSKMVAVHCGTKPGRFETSNHLLSHELGSESASERMSAAERVSQASSVESANE